MTDRILVFNAAGASNEKARELGRWIRYHNPDVCIISELGRLGDELSKQGDLFTHEKSDTGIPDTAVLVRRGEVDNVIRKQLTPWIDRSNTDAPRLWADRHVIRVRINRRVYYSIHANAAICGPEHNWIDNEGADVWHRAIKTTLSEMIEKDREKEHRIRLAGDWNFHRSTAPDSPNNYYHERNMSYRSDNAVMFAGYTRYWDKCVQARTLGIAPGADAHRALRLDLELK